MSAVIDRHVDDVVTDEYRRLQSELVPLIAGRLDATDIHYSVREIDRFYNQAWHALLAALRVKAEPSDRATFLAETTYRRAVDAFRVTNPDRNLDGNVLEALGIQDPIAETPEQQRALSEVAQRLRADSSQRELGPAALLLVHGMPGPAIAEALGLPLERLEAIIAAVRSEIAPAFEGTLPDEACAEQIGLITRFALGAFDPRSDEYSDAVRHLKGCDGCRRHALSARCLAAVAVPSGEMFVALTGTSSFRATTPAAPLGAPRAASPLTGGAKRETRGGGKIAAGIAAALVLSFALFSLVSPGGDGDNAAQTSAVSSKSAAEKSEARAAKAKSKAKAKRKARAARQRRARERASARRAAARARARARARAQAATPVASPVQTQTQAPQAAPQQPAQSKPKSKPQPKPSTDPTEEFGN